MSGYIMGKLRVGPLFTQDMVIEAMVIEADDGQPIPLLALVGRQVIVLPEGCCNCGALGATDSIHHSLPGGAEISVPHCDIGEGCLSHLEFRRRKGPEAAGEREKP